MKLRQQCRALSAQGRASAIMLFLLPPGVAFMANLEGPRDVLNSLAQAKGRRAGVHTGRFAVNTTVGVVGLFDVAERWFAWTASPETLSETLGVWGTPTGTYLILPVVGEFCTRSLVGWVGDGVLNPLGWIPGAPPAGPTPP